MNNLWQKKFVGWHLDRFFENGIFGKKWRDFTENRPTCTWRKLQLVRFSKQGTKTKILLWKLHAQTLSWQPVQRYKTKSSRKNIQKQRSINSNWIFGNKLLGGRKCRTFQLCFILPRYWKCFLKLITIFLWTSCQTIVCAWSFHNKNLGLLLCIENLTNRNFLSVLVGMFAFENFDFFSKICVFESSVHVSINEFSFVTSLL